MTRIRITIDELVVDGAGNLAREQLTAALEQALAREVAARGLPPAGNVTRIEQNVQGTDAGTVARQVARAVYGGKR